MTGHRLLKNTTVASIPRKKPVLNKDDLLSHESYGQEWITSAGYLCRECIDENLSFNC